LPHTQLHSVKSVTCKNEPKDLLFTQWKYEFNRRSKLQELFNLKLPKISLRRAFKTIKVYSYQRQIEQHTQSETKLVKRQTIL